MIASEKRLEDNGMGTERGDSSPDHTSGTANPRTEAERLARLEERDRQRRDRLEEVLERQELLGQKIDSYRDEVQAALVEDREKRDQKMREKHAECDRRFAAIENEQRPAPGQRLKAWLAIGALVVAVFGGVAGIVGGYTASVRSDLLQAERSSHQLEKDMLKSVARLSEDDLLLRGELARVQDRLQIQPMNRGPTRGGGPNRLAP
jgi:hypothetical protein